jgi:hypothetical protein
MPPAYAGVAVSVPIPMLGGQSTKQNANRVKKKST